MPPRLAKALITANEISCYKAVGKYWPIIARVRLKRALQIFTNEGRPAVWSAHAWQPHATLVLLSSRHRVLFSAQVGGAASLRRFRTFAELFLILPSNQVSLLCFS